MTKVTQSLGTADPFLYINMVAGFQNPFCGYGAENMAFLREVSAKYTGGGIFHTFVPGGFKLPDAC